MAKTTKDAEAVQNTGKVQVHLFRDNDKYKNDVFVCVNGRTALIQRG